MHGFRDGVSETSDEAWGAAGVGGETAEEARAERRGDEGDTAVVLCLSGRDQRVLVHAGCQRLSDRTWAANC